MSIKSAELPKGYHVWTEAAEVITIAVTDFLLILVDAEPFINYDGRIWKRGPLVCIPIELASNVCSMREYELV